MCKITEKKISECLRSVGISANLLGFEYIKSAVMIISGQDEPSRRITRRNIVKKLYPQIADIHNSTPSRVERGIRHAIEKMYLLGDVDSFDKILGFPSLEKGKLTNSEFIFALFEYLRYDD